MKRFTYFLFLCLFITSCKKIDVQKTAQEKKSRISAQQIQKNINELNLKKEAALDLFINNLSIEQKVSQLFIENLEGDRVFVPVEKTGALTGNPKSGSALVPGGYLFFSYNLADNIKDIMKFTDSIRDYCVKNNIIPPFLTIDQEGGFVNRLKVVAGPLPSCQRVSQCLTVQKAYELYSLQAIQMAALGFNMNLAPVVETCTEKNKLFLNGRSFGSTENVINYGTAAVNAFQNNNIASVIKHFPGNTNTDPHTGLPEIDVTPAELEEMLYPFVQIMKNNPVAVLMSHARTSIVDKDVPACLSTKWVDEILRGTYGYEGIIFSDDIFMAALAKLGYPPEVASVRAIEVGVDCIMISEKRFANAAAAIIKEALRESAFEAKINKSVKRILKYKIQCGLLKYVNNDDGSFSIEFNNPFENLNTRESIFNSARRKNIDLYIDYFTIPSKVKL